MAMTTWISCGPRIGDEVGWNENQPEEDPGPPGGVDGTAPIAAVELDAVGSGPASFHVSWKTLPVESNGGLPITSYVAYATPALGGSRQTCQATAIETSCTITHAIPNVEQDIYSIQVLAWNAEGHSPWSEPMWASPTPPKDFTWFSDDIDVEREDGPTSTIAVDLDGDADRDLVTTSYQNDSVFWLKNNGDGQFQNRTDLDTELDGAIRVRGGDLDQDGDIDLVVAARKANLVVWHENLGEDGFSSRQALVSGTSADGASFAMPVDLDGDGLLDILFCAHDVDEASWIRNEGLENDSLAFSDPMVIDDSVTGIWKLHAADLDLDGDADVLSASLDDDTIGWFENLGDREFSGRRELSTSVDYASSVYAGDLDGDGDMDVVSTGYRDHSVSWFENLGQGEFSSEEQIETDHKKIQGPSQVMTSDLDLDGDLDLVVAAMRSNSIVWIENVGASFPNDIWINRYWLSGARSIYPEDLDGDGDFDVSASGYYYDGITVHLSDGGAAAPSAPLRAPYNVSVTPVALGLQVSWTALRNSETGGSRVLRYRVVATPENGGESVECVAEWPETSCTILGLAEGIEYSVKVRAENLYGTGADSIAVAGVPDPGHSISGTLVVAQHYVVDSDTWEALNEDVSNDDLDHAQAIELEASVAGNVDSFSDQEDWYRIDLDEEAFSILLFISDWHEDTGDWLDLDLYLLDEDGTVVDASLSGNQYDNQERIDLDGTRSGVHYIRVRSEDAGSNYLLSVGTIETVGNAVAVVGQHSPRADFIPGEVIVRLEPSEQKQWSINGLNRYMAIHGMNVKSGQPNRAMLVGLSHSALVQRSGPAGLRMAGTSMKFESAEMADKARTLLEAKRIARTAGIKYAEINRIVKPARTPNDEHYHLQWHYENISLPDAWDLETGDEDVVVAVLDTGYLDHPDMAGQWVTNEDGTVAGYDFVSEANSYDGDGLDPDPFDTPYDSHGTHVAGTIAAATDNEAGVAGVSWDSRILPVRVLGPWGDDYGIGQGLRYAAGLENDSGTVPETAAKIINISLGSQGFSCIPQEKSEFYTEVYDDVVRGQGVLVVKAAGNENCRYVDGFSIDHHVVTVSATDYANERSYYSNYGFGIKVAAPGGDVTRDLNEDGYLDGVLSTVCYVTDDCERYSFWHGTSMAAPHVAGVAALMMSANEDLNAYDVIRLLRDDHPDENAGPIVQDLGEEGWDATYGYGLIDASLAVQVSQDITGGIEPLEEPGLSARPVDYYLWHGNTTAEFKFWDDQDTGELEIEDVETDVDWLSFEIDSEEGIITATADREQLVTGQHTADFTIVSNGGKIGGMIVVLQNEPEAAGDLGVVRVWAEDDRSNVVAWVNVDTGEDPSFVIDNLPSDYFYVTAASDWDGDECRNAFFCRDQGEAWGGYPLLRWNYPVDLRHESAEDIDFALDVVLDGFTPSPFSTEQAGESQGDQANED